MYAVKAYREAGEYKKAAMLLTGRHVQRSRWMLQIHSKRTGPVFSETSLYATLLEHGNAKAMDVFRR
jgi:hypothetical protein